jgi:preprotein translocase subunit SecA
MDYLREGIHLRGLAQTDPLVAWQREGFEMFGKLVQLIDTDYLRYVMRMEVVVEAPSLPIGTDLAQAFYQSADSEVAELAQDAAGPVTGLEAFSLGGEVAVPEMAHKLGRNDKCWCGSGKKYKHCHGAAVD